MRLNNRNKIDYYHFLFTALMLLLFLGILGFFLEIYRFNILGISRWLLLIVPLILFLIFLFLGRQIFEYDSDGEALHFKNRNIFPLFGKPLNDEFPKYKLLKYEIVNAFIFKRLYVTISSKKSPILVLKYEISYLTDKQIKDLKLSLNKVIKANQEARETNC